MLSSPDERMRNPPSMHLSWCRTASPDAPSTTVGFLSDLFFIPALATTVPPSIADTSMVRCSWTVPGWIPLRIPSLARIPQRYARFHPRTIPVPNPPASGVYTFRRWKARRIRFADTAIVRLYSGTGPEEWKMNMKTNEAVRGGGTRLQKAPCGNRRPCGRVGGLRCHPGSRRRQQRR